MNSKYKIKPNKKIELGYKYDFKQILEFKLDIYAKIINFHILRKKPSKVL